MQASDRAYVLELGKIVLEGPSVELLESDDVRKAYLGNDKLVGQRNEFD